MLQWLTGVFMSNFFCKPLQNLIKQKRLPMLFIGSGLSKRYLKDYPNWEQLLLSLANDVNISESQILAIKQEITDKNPNCTQSEIFRVIASRITEKLRTDIANGTRLLEDFFSYEEIEEIKKNNIPFVKMLIAKKFKDYQIINSQKVNSEIEELKKLQNNIGVVLTTNYDTFLEKHIFKNFACFTEQSQYYMTESEGIGEIYKIHGCISNPKSLIFNTDDYVNFESNLKVVVAKILSLLLDYPLIFIGYSLEDENIKNILYTLLSCINVKQIESLTNRLICITWKKNENKLVVSKKTINQNGKTLTITNIETDNFFHIFKYLQKFYPNEKPERVRKFKRMIRTLVHKNTAGQNTIFTTEENLDKLNDENNLVIAFGGTQSLAERGLVGFEAIDLLKIVLKQTRYSIEYCEKIIEHCYVKNKKIAQGHFVPIFYFLKGTDKFQHVQKIKDLKQNIINYVEKLNSNLYIPILKDNNNILQNLKKQQKSKIISVLIKSYANNIITYTEYITTINNILNDPTLDFSLNSTEIRKAVTFADLK